MPATEPTTSARAVAHADGDVLDVALGGDWQVTGKVPNWTSVIDRQAPRRVRLRLEGLGRWDSSLLLFVMHAQDWCRNAGAACDAEALPEEIRTLSGQLATSHETRAPFDRSEGFLANVGRATIDIRRNVGEIFHFVGETVISATRLARSPARFRWRDWAYEMQQCGAMALPIVSLISFLVGVTLAYTGAIVLRQYGGDIYIADLIGLSMVRETGAVMTAVVLAGRTGAAFAATLGNMKANEEIDALETLGIAPVQFLVLPRLLALAVMMPLLSVYANALGMIGGMAVALGILDIQPTAYWAEMQTSIDMSDLAVGVIKAVAFGLIIGLSGCLRGLQAERSAAGVGRAATSAVVTAILFLVVADALFAVVFNILGL
ncbi:ABC transporter permease [Opitutus sp. ER46]|uniref:MlaE family ABC transporter permease n=1 Tax=Opitutus sp. ER46 TaxID=2161864 RepID=UPI000D326254|nr:ABC transporter permease [Opitutus sp. ER46]PTX97889.1 ABC transporter permease [Opitutus sp. ER46]